MSELTRRILVSAPPDVVARNLARIAAAPAWSLSLRAPVRLHGLGAEIVMCRDTIARLASDATAPEASVAVHWEPPPGESFPRFDGHVWSEAETSGTTWLRLEGEYATRAARERIAERGEETIGHRIARANAKRFLDALASAILELRAA